MLTVGYTRDTYAEKRLIMGAVPGIIYKEVPSSGGFYSPVLFNDQEKEWSAVIQPGTCDVAHLFNQVNYGEAPYVTSFETLMPRYWREKAFVYGAHVLANDTCRKLLAMSAAAYTITEVQLRKLASPLYEALMRKIVVLHPPQAIIPNASERFRAPDPVRFMFIGRDLFGKGGLAMIRAFGRIRPHFPNMTLTVVASLAINQPYNVTQAGKEEIREALSFFRRNKDWVTWHSSLPNDQVLALLPEHHVGLLPSFVDTYGYAVLEMQAAGLPVVTTDVRAFPEINPNDAGWRIMVPALLALDSPQEAIVRALALLQRDLEKVLTDIMENPTCIAEKSLAAQARIRACHCPEAYARSLRAVYEGEGSA